MTMYSPPHPGETLREDVLPALGVGVTEAADKLGVSRQTLSAVLNARQAITPEMAARIEAWLGVEHGGRAEIWLAQQAAFDLWHVRQAKSRALAGIARSAAFANAKRSVVIARNADTGRIRAAKETPAAGRAKPRLAARKG